MVQEVGEAGDDSPPMKQTRYEVDVPKSFALRGELLTSWQITYVIKFNKRIGWETPRRSTTKRIIRETKINSPCASPRIFRPLGGSHQRWRMRESICARQMSRAILHALQRINNYFFCSTKLVKANTPRIALKHWSNRAKTRLKCA